MLNGETEIFDDSNHIYAPALLLARLLRRSGSESVKNSTNFAGVQVRTCLRTDTANLSVTLVLFCFAGGLTPLFLPAAIAF